MQLVMIVVMVLMAVEMMMVMLVELSLWMMADLLSATVRVMETAFHFVCFSTFRKVGVSIKGLTDSIL